MTPPVEPPRIRIGELSRLTGVSPVLLRAWETRYGLLMPERSGGGTRLYSADDVLRVQDMRAQIDSGVAPSEAALRIRHGRPAPDGPVTSRQLEAAGRILREAFIELDGTTADEALGALLATFPFEIVTTRVLLPYLRDVGARWERDQTAIAEEHMASNVIRGRLLALARRSSRPRLGAVVLACPPGEQHDLPLVFLTVSLAQRGWHFSLLGANTPVATMAEAADDRGADGIVISAMFPERFTEAAGEMSRLAARHRLLIAGPGASQAQATAIGAVYLSGDPVAAVVAIEQALSR